MGHGTRIVFPGLLGPARDQRDPWYSMFMGTHFPAGNPHSSCSHPSIHSPLPPPLLPHPHQFPLHPQWPLVPPRFPSSLSASASSLNLFATLYLIASKRAIFWLCHVVMPVCLLSFLPFCIPPSPYSATWLFPEGVCWQCDRMMSQQRSSVSADDCQLGQTLMNLLHCQTSEKGMRFPWGPFSCTDIESFCSHTHQPSVTSQYHISKHWLQLLRFNIWLRMWGFTVLHATALFLACLW